MIANEMTYEGWLLALPRSDEAYQGSRCPACGSIGLHFQYFSIETGNVGWKQVWCSTCLNGVSVSRVIVPEGCDVLRTEDKYSSFVASHPGIKLVT